MKNRMKSGLTMRVILMCMLAAMLPVLNSCKKQVVNTGDLLATVPSSSSVVVGINVESLLTKSECKVNGTEVTPSDPVKAWLAANASDRSMDSLVARMLFSGESGVDPTAAIFFMDAYNSYITLALSDTQKFKDYVENETASSFYDAGNDVEVCGNIAVRGAQAWVAEGTVIDPKAVANYSTLDEGQSFLAKDFSERIASMSADIVGWGEIKRLAGGKVDFGTLSSMNIFLGMVFDDAQSLFFSAEMKKGEAKAIVSVFNKDGKPAKYLLPSAKLNMETVKGVAESAQTLLAINITKDLVKKVDNILSSFGGSDAAKMSTALKSLDGTAVVALSDGGNLNGVVTTNGNPGLDLKQLISTLGTISTDGNLMRFSKGTVSGGLEVAKAADYLKDASIGVVVSLQSPEVKAYAGSDLRTVAVAFVPKNGSLEADVTLVANDDSRNILLSILDIPADNGAAKN